jgi:hypothetical protein
MRDEKQSWEPYQTPKTSARASLALDSREPTYIV